MELTSASEYAVLALIHLARQTPGRRVTPDAIASTQDIPSDVLEPILLALKRARYVDGRNGQHAGYRLAKKPGDITIAEVIRLFDGALAPTVSLSRYFCESTPIEKEKNLLRVLNQIRTYVSGKLASTTLADLR